MSICWFFCKITRMAKFVLADIIYGLTKVAFVLGYSYSPTTMWISIWQILEKYKRFQHFWHFCLCLINNALAIVVEHHLIFITDIQPHENRSNMIRPTDLSHLEQAQTSVESSRLLAVMVPLKPLLKSRVACGSTMCEPEPRMEARL